MTNTPSRKHTRSAASVASFIVGCVQANRPGALSCGCRIAVTSDVPSSSGFRDTEAHLCPEHLPAAGLLEGNRYAPTAINCD